MTSQQDDEVIEVLVDDNNTHNSEEVGGEGTELQRLDLGPSEQRDDGALDYARPVTTALEVAWEGITIKHHGHNILHGVSGSVKGRLLAIMGGSGSGKTTLLNYLARRLHKNTKASDGESRLNGSSYSSRTLKQVAGYVMQDDLMFANLSVEETIMCSAELRLPAETTPQERTARVDEVIRQLGLDHCRKTIIGDELRRGVSGGERKRVAVAIELLLKPKVLMLDEPTSGLDAASALSLIQTFHNLAVQGVCTIICTIHQPQTKIFNLFDDLILLNKGRVLYQGPRSQVVKFYEEADLPCPPYTNPADHILDVVTYVNGCDEKLLFENQKKLENLNIKMHEKDQKAIPVPNNYGEKDSASVANWTPPVVHRIPWIRQFTILCNRSLKETFRNRTVIVAQVVQNIIMAILIGTVFFQIGEGQASVTRRQPSLFFCVINQGVFAALIVVNIFPSERKIILRERAAGSYFVSAYYMAKIATDTLMQLTSPIMFSCIVYWLVGYQAHAGKFFIFTVFMILCSLSATSIALFVSAVCRTTTYAVSILPAALEVTRLFGGFFLSPANLPTYFSWLDALSYAKYTYVGISLNELDGLELSCTPAQRNADGNCPTANGEQTMSSLGLDTFSIEACAFILIAMVVFFRVAAYLAIRYIKS